MKIADILFEMQSNYVAEDDILLIENYIKENGLNLTKIDQKLEELGYDAIFDDFDSNDYSVVQKIQHRKHLSD
jgi:molybdenum cofactor biosynthesis enzyme MoaA